MSCGQMPSLWESTGPAGPRSVAIDTETTGLGSDRRLLQLAVVDANTEQTLANMFFNPGVESDPGALAVHGLTAARLQAYDAMTPEDARSILNLLAPARIIAHNARFDLDTVMAELREFGLAFVPEDVVDTGLLAKRELPGIVPERQRMPSLDVAAAWVGLAPRVGCHDAVADARLCLSLYNRLVAELARASPGPGLFQTVRQDGPFIRVRPARVARYCNAVAVPTAEQVAVPATVATEPPAPRSDHQPGPAPRSAMQRRAVHAIRTIGHGERQAMALSTDDLKRAIRTELNIAIAAVRTRDQTLGRVRDLERENSALRDRLATLEECLYGSGASC
jgi:DNA polymerase III epsilon subunit-like protein